MKMGEKGEKGARRGKGRIEKREKKDTSPGIEPRKSSNL